MNYLKMKDTRKEIVIPDQLIEITWMGLNKDRFIELGYKYTRCGDKFLCKATDLSPTSRKRIIVECPVCGDKRNLRYESVMTLGHSLCRRCVQINDLTGKSFGRLTVLELDKDRRGNTCYWLCECECGAVKSVRSEKLIKGSVVSCGCYRKEIKSGENSHLWNPDLTDEERMSGRANQEYTTWIKHVLDRDRYTCQICGRNKVKLHVHHLYSFFHYPKKRICPENGITMCKKHHRQFHKWMGGTQVPCTPADLDRWLYETDRAIRA